MAARLIAVDDGNPRLPDTVIVATVGTTADDFAAGDTLVQAEAYMNVLAADLDARIMALEASAESPGVFIVFDAIHEQSADHVTLSAAGGAVFTLAPANAAHAHTAGNVVLLPEGPVELTVQAGATSVTPWVQLQSGSTATVTWKASDGSTLATGLKPTIARPTDGIVRMFVTQAGLPAMNQVDSFNLGFNSGDDPGRDNIGPTYNHPGQPVTDLAGLQLLTGMRYLMAAHTPLRSIMNCTGMDNLEHIEVFQSDIPTMTLTGCTSLIRLCVEGGSIEFLDLSSVKNCLRDLRAGRTSALAGITFVSDGPLTAMYHYCVVYQNVVQHIPNSQLPVVEQYWPYGTGMVSIDPPTSPLMNDIRLFENPLSQATIDAFILHCANNVSGDGRLQFAPDIPPSPFTDAAVANLVSRGWDLSIPPSDTLGVDGSAGTWTPPTHQPWVLANLAVLPASGQITTVTGGVLTTNNNGYFRTIFRPNGRTTRGHTYFEVQADRSELDPAGGTATQTWGLIVNANSSGNYGVRCLISWPSTNTANANGVAIAWSNSSSYSGTLNVVTRIAPNPAGWTNAGLHKVGLYLAGDCAYVVLDGVKVYKCQNAYIDTLGQGPYCGVAGDSNSTDRLWQSWGLADVTLP